MSEKLNEWTIMVYMAGNNNLSEDMITSINDLDAGILSGIIRATSSSVGTPSDINQITFFIEFHGNHPTVKPRRFIFVNGKKFEEPCAVVTTNGEGIKNLVIDGMNKYPANKYALIISGHSDAFQGRTLLVNENPPGVTTIHEIRDKLKEALTGRKLQILGFDSCVMNTLEVIYEFQEVTEYWVGSQGSIPNYTWNYREIGAALVQKKDKFESTEIIKLIVEKNRDFNVNYAFNGRAVDISGFSMDFFRPEFIPTLDSLFFLLITSLIKPLVDMLNKMDDTEPNFAHYPILRMLILTHWKTQTFMHDQSIDLRDFCECLIESCEQTVKEIISYPITPIALSPDALTLIAQFKSISVLSKAVLDKLDASFSKGATVGADYRFANGVSLFFPWSYLGYQLSSKEYENLGFIRETDTGGLWRFFILLFSILTQRPRPKFDPNIIDPKIFDVFRITEVFAIDHEKDKKSTTKLKTLFAAIDINSLFKILFDGSGGTKDDHPRSRGLDDSYSYYFRRTKNIRSNDSDLKDSRSFEKP